tara:strand:+ start:227090 stop:227305 length:216 start_codon:yes stop_codon:yes gene_type:complete
MGDRLAAYSCGGSFGFGSIQINHDPDLHRTEFPFDPLMGTAQCSNRLPEILNATTEKATGFAMLPSLDQRV